MSSYICQSGLTPSLHPPTFSELSLLNYDNSLVNNKPNAGLCALWRFSCLLLTYFFLLVLILFFFFFEKWQSFSLPLQPIWEKIAIFFKYNISLPYGYDYLVDVFFSSKQHSIKKTPRYKIEETISHYTNSQYMTRTSYFNSNYNQQTNK